MDVASLEIADLVNLIHPNPHQDLAEISEVERKDVIRELLIRRKDFADFASNEIFKDALSSILPPMPKDEASRLFQIDLARKLINKDEKNPGFGLWSNFSDSRLLELFCIVEPSSMTEAQFYAKSLFATCCERKCFERLYRGQLSFSARDRKSAEYMVDSAIYSFIRRQLPPTDSIYFRPVAKGMIRFILDPAMED